MSKSTFGENSNSFSLVFAVRILLVICLLNAAEHAGEQNFLLLASDAIFIINSSPQFSHFLMTGSIFISKSFHKQRTSYKRKQKEKRRTVSLLNLLLSLDQNNNDLGK